MKIVGITGQSGTGKTTIAKMLQEKWDAEIVDADKIAKDLTKKGSIYLKSIVKEFGPEVLMQNGRLNRKRLANIVFQDEEKRKQLNQLTFFYVVKEIKERIGKVQHKQVILIDAPLLYESDLNQICDCVIGVIASTSSKIERICKRNGISQEEAKKRLKVQITDTFLKENADILIRNTKEKEELRKQIEKIKI